MKATLTITILLFAGFATPSGAQSATNFSAPPTPTADNPEATSPVAAAAVAPAPDRETISELLASPSRYAGLDPEGYIQALTTSFSMRNREVDPFARHQDPTFRPAQPVIKKKIAKLKKEPVTPFSDIIARIGVTAVIPAQHTFLVNERSFRVGDRINLDVGKEDLLAVHVMSIQADSVTFRNGSTGETADLILKLIPEGMSRGGNSLPPGLITDRSNSPVDARPQGGAYSSRR